MSRVSSSAKYRHRRSRNPSIIGVTRRATRRVRRQAPKRRLRAFNPGLRSHRLFPRNTPNPPTSTQSRPNRSAPTSSVCDRSGVKRRSNRVTVKARCIRRFTPTPNQLWWRVENYRRRPSPNERSLMRLRRIRPSVGTRSITCWSCIPSCLRRTPSPGGQAAQGLNCAFQFIFILFSNIVLMLTIV